MSVPFAGELFTFEEPDGSLIRLLGWGNQFHAVFETLDGYTVVNDPATGYHHYAGLSDDGTSCSRIGPRVGTVAAGVTRHSAAPAHARAPRRPARRRPQLHDELPGERRWEERRRDARRGGCGRGPAQPPRPTAVGDVVGLCLLVQFPDVPGTIARQEVDDFCNQVGYTGFGNNGSVRDYFLDVSDGKLRTERGHGLLHRRRTTAPTTPTRRSRTAPAPES